MSNKIMDTSEGFLIYDRFPKSTSYADSKMNAAVALHGLRFYKDQTPVEYLAELFLVFASPKGRDKDNLFSFILADNPKELVYWPKNNVALKLFCFFPTSRLDTRHPVHQKSYLSALESIKYRISGEESNKEEIVRLIQSLLFGFVGVSNKRTWSTCSFLPVNQELISCEVNWLHGSAIKKVSSDSSWEDASYFFKNDRHIFMARGGELLFLQLANLFNNHSFDVSFFTKAQEYSHLRHVDISQLQKSIEEGLSFILKDSLSGLSDVSNFINSALKDYNVALLERSFRLGWIPSATATESLLFAKEIENICQSSISLLDKIDLLQILCCMHVLRTICFQSRRIDQTEKKTQGFVGNYVWIPCNVDSTPSDGLRKMAQVSISKIESLLYRSLRSIEKLISHKNPSRNEADKHGFEIFRSLGKKIGIIVPRTGRGQRFVLTPSIIRFLVTALIPPGERIRLTDFCARVFAHYGIALGDQQLAVALHWNGHDSGGKEYAVAADTTWIEEALQQGGFLVELSDAVSIVHNPGS